MSYHAAEADRRIANTVQIGTITSIDAAKGTAWVQMGDLASPELPVGQIRAGGVSLWWMPTVGEQVVVACPSGDVARGVVLTSVYAGNAPSSDAAVPKVYLAGGKIIFDGDIEVTGDVIASGVSLVHHRHGQVSPGSARTGEPA